MNDFNHAHKERQRIANNILKSFANVDDVIEGAGEGLRGGKVIGHTRSSKPIYANKGSDYYKDFSKDDHHDAAAVHYKKQADATGPKQDEKHRNARNSHAEAAGLHAEDDGYGNKKVNSKVQEHAKNFKHSSYSDSLVHDENR